MADVNSGDLETHLSLKHVIQSAQQHDHCLKKINKLHEKLQASRTEAGLEISMKAAVKLLLAYEASVNSCQSLMEYENS